MVTLTQNMENRYFVVDKDYIISYANLNTEEAPKFESEKMTGKPCYKVFYSLDTPCTHAPCGLTEVLRTGEAQKRVHVYRDAEGREHPVEMQYFPFPIRNKNGEITHVIIISKCITDLKKVEEDEEIQKQLIQVEKWTALREMMGDFVLKLNKLNNPLASALGYAQLGYRLLPPHRKQEAFLKGQNNFFHGGHNEKGNPEIS